MCKIMEDVEKSGRVKVALELISEGTFSLEKIAKLTKLTLSEVKALAKKKTA